MSDIVDPLPTISPAEYEEVQKKRGEETVKKLAREAHQRISEGLKTTSRRTFDISAQDEGLLSELEAATELVKGYFEQSGWEVEVEDGWSYMRRLHFNLPGTRATKKRRTLKIVGVVTAVVLALGAIGGAVFHQGLTSKIGAEKSYCSGMSWVKGRGFNKFTVDYAESISGALNAVKVGQVHFRSELENGTFDQPRQGVETHEFAVLKFNEPSMTTKEVLGWMEKEGWRPANLRELMAYINEVPDEYKLGRLLALGSIGHASFSSGHRCLAVPALCSGGESSILQPIEAYYETWTAAYRFLVVKK